MGEDEGRGPRWGMFMAVFVVLLLGLGVYRLVSGPSTSAPEPAAAAAEQPREALALSGGSVRSDATAPQGTSLHLGRDLVTLRGPGVQQAHREASAVALGRLRGGWLVKLTSKACEGRADPQVSYGVARASGRFTAWDSALTARRPTWRSPDRALVLVEGGSQVRLKRTATGKVLAEFKTAG